MTSLENLQELIDLLDGESGITELSIHGTDGAQITVRRSATVSAGGSLVPTSMTPLPPDEQGNMQSEVVSIEEEERDDAETTIARTVVVTANRVGVFHAAKQPLNRGDQIAGGQIVGYIESMKLMNEVLSDAGGEVAERMVDDVTPVEYGQPLFRLNALP